MSMFFPFAKPVLHPLDGNNGFEKEVCQHKRLPYCGPKVNEFELRVKEYFNLPHFLFLNNSAIALQMAIKALGLKGEIITTPFSLPSIIGNIIREDYKPVFVDIESDSFNIDPIKIKEKITPKTSAIFATHVFGNPCKVNEIDAIAREFNLKVIYDASHCFGVKYMGQSILEKGDISLFNFQSSKFFQTMEGCGIFTQDQGLIKKIINFRKQLSEGPEGFDMEFIYRKNSEFHAAIGLDSLNQIEMMLQNRKAAYHQYQENLLFKGLGFQIIEEQSNYNFSHFPLVFESEAMLKKVEKNLFDNLIYTRRYFHPTQSNNSFIENSNCPISEQLTSTILCLPMYNHLSASEINFILKILLRTLNY